VISDLISSGKDALEDLAASIIRWDRRDTFAPSASSMISKSRTDRVKVSFGFVILRPFFWSGLNRPGLQAELFLSIKLTQKHANLADLRVYAFDRRRFVQVAAFEGQQFQAIIHNRSDAVDFGVVEAMHVLHCHCGTR
jgi:hypothetical protein